MRRLIIIVALCTMAAPWRPAAAEGRFATVDRVMRRAVRERAFESAVVRVSRRGKLLYEGAYGGATKQSVFDLASLTKPLATTTSLMRLADKGKLSPKTPLREVLPELGLQPVGQSQLSQLLSHSAGLPARNKLRDQTRGLSPQKARKALPRLAARYPRAYRPGKESLYSDLNFLLLGWAAETAGGKRLDKLSQQLVFAPLGLRSTGFLPQAEGRGTRFGPTIATEKPEGEARIKGVVHDEKARSMGGVAGHAGLFSTAGDVQRILDSMLSAYHGRASLFSSGMVRRFFESEPVAGSGRRLGWTTPSPTTAGALFAGKNAIGHTGFTGTSAWMDLDSELSVVLLTNRVYYGRDATKFKKYRALVHDAVGRGLSER